MLIDVVLIRPRASGDGAVRALAAAIAARYGVPAQALVDRLSVGSFRVKSGADLETATRYASDLESMGAVCELRDQATGQVIAPPTAETPQADKPDDTPGLAAASGAFSQDLGALGDGVLSLSTLDGGSGDIEPPPIAGAPLSEPYDLSTPPAGQLALAPVTPQGEIEEAPRTDSNMFAPPDDGDGEDLVLAIDPRDAATPADAPPPMPGSKKAATMAPEQLVAAPGQAHAMLSPTDHAATVSSKPTGPSLGDRFSENVRRAREALAGRTRGAFITGVACALLIGFVAAHVVGVIQESGAYSTVRNDLRASYAEAVDHEAHAALPTLRASAIDLIDSRQKRIAITSLVVWLLAAGGTAFVWFRLVKWERLGQLSSLGGGSSSP